jgi:hypothetical protein
MEAMVSSTNTQSAMEISFISGRCRPKVTSAFIGKFMIFRLNLSVFPSTLINPSTSTTELQKMPQT